MRASSDKMKAIEERSGIIRSINFIKRIEQEKRERLNNPVPITFVRDEYDFFVKESNKIRFYFNLFLALLFCVGLVFLFI